MQDDNIIVWNPLPGSQELALDTRADETLYCGTRGPGKSEIQLARFRRYVGIGYGAFWRGVIFDREYKNLDDLVSKSKRFFNKFQDGARFLSSGKDYKWVWLTGEELLFRVAKKSQDYWNYHGQEFPFIGWNELTKYPTPDIYDMMLSCNRSSFKPEIEKIDLPEIPLNIFSTTNSKGPGRIWVKKRFIDPMPYGVVAKKEINSFDPSTQEDVIITRKRVAIFGSFKENIYLDARYIAGMMDSIKDKNTYNSWIKGSWDVSDGGAFDDLWSNRVHVIPRFPVPDNWRIDRSFDWGSTHPFSVQWWAEANGETVELPDGSHFTPTRGTLILIAEWYGCQEIGLNKGLKLSPKTIAEGIKLREQKLLDNGWITKKPSPGPADNQIGNEMVVDEDSIEKKMFECGIAWEKSDKSKGSRKNGLVLFRDRLLASLKNEGAGVYTMRNCPAFIEIIPSLPRDVDDQDDIDTTCEDHIWDSTRYRILKGNDRYSSNLIFR